MNFIELSQNWQQQDNSKKLSTTTDIVNKAKIQSKALRQKKLWTIGILSFTCIVLITFFISVGAYNNWKESLGLSLMITMLVIRVVLELISKNHLQNIDQTLDFQSYVLKLNGYFKNRRWIHFVFTPIIYLVYFGGFVSMLPVFKVELSFAFYLYILISGIVVFVGLAVFIAFHIRKELQDLQFLKHVFES